MIVETSFNNFALALLLDKAFEEAMIGEDATGLSRQAAIQIHTNRSLKSYQSPIELNEDELELVKTISCSFNTGNVSKDY